MRHLPPAQLCDAGRAVSAPDEQGIERLADGRPDFGANGRQWKTPPLWGTGLIKDVNGHTRLLHDGRARGVLEAILWHGGEADAAREQVLKMKKADRDALVKFVESL